MSGLIHRDREIWVLEDDPEAMLVYREILDVRYSMRCMGSIRELACALGEAGPNLLIADLRLADGNFLGFLGEEQAACLLKAPFLVVSSCDDLDVLRTCFEEGALDYLTKPFTRSELIVKVERIFNASAGRPDLKDPVLPGLHAGIPVADDFLSQFTPKELQIFSVLYRAKGKKVNRKDIQDLVWRGIAVTPKTLDVHLFNLRKKLRSSKLKVEFSAPDGYFLSGEGMN